MHQIWKAKARNNLIIHASQCIPQVKGRTASIRKWDSQSALDDQVMWPQYGKEAANEQSMSRSCDSGHPHMGVNHRECYNSMPFGIYVRIQSTHCLSSVFMGRAILGQEAMQYCYFGGERVSIGQCVVNLWVWGGWFGCEWMGVWPKGLLIIEEVAEGLTYIGNVIQCIWNFVLTRISYTYIMMPNYVIDYKYDLTKYNVISLVLANT